MPEEQVIDPQVIASLQALSPESDGAFVRELIEIFLQDTPQRLAEIDAALGKPDLPTFTRAAHSIKGSSGNFGANRLAALAHELELLGKSGNLAAAPGLRDRLKGEYALVAAALAKIAGGK